MSVMRLDKYLTLAGCGTRSEVKKELKYGSVTVNAEVIRKPEYKIDPEADTVCRNGIPLLWKPFVCLMFYKPAGCITATTDKMQKTVMDYIDHPQKAELFPVGRLDIDTEGLLFLMNDGALAHRLLSPRCGIKKTYFVRTEGIVTEEDAAAFQEGVSIGEGEITLPAELEILRSAEQSESLLTICEGKFHQVKRMFAVRGKKVCYLKRVSMAGFALDPALQPGQWRELTEEEAERLRQSC